MKKPLAIGVLAIVVASVWLWISLNNPTDIATRVHIEQGTSLRGALSVLETEGVLKHPRMLYVYARLTRQTQVRAGTYQFKASHSALDILYWLQRGMIVTESFTLAEGLNRWQVRDLLARQHWIEPKVFDALCDDATFLKRNHIPGPTCEGYLFPETYVFARNVPAQTIFQKLFATHTTHFQKAIQLGSGPLNLGERELITLASIVEKETGAAVERPHIACLFYNRLRANPKWRLDTDPTVIYAARLLNPNFNGNIRHRHLRQYHPYNTYTVVGLPPGPIANPGRAALLAVLQPSACNDFFFVSMNNGHHIFCPTLECHERAVKKWQIDYFRKKR